MSKKDEFIRKMHSKLDKWNAQIDALSERAEKAEDSAKEEYKKQINTLRAKRDEAKTKLDKLENASEGAWEDLKSGVEMAWDSVSEAVDSAVTRFRS